MVGASVTIKPEGLERTERQLRQLVAAGQDLTPLMRDIGEYLLRSTRDRFEEERDPDDRPWAPLSEATKRRKTRNRDRILTRDGHLGGTLAYRASSAMLRFGSPLIYAGTMHFGARKGEFGTTARGGPVPWGDIPAREFLGLSNADRDEIGLLVRDYLLEKL